MGFAMVESLCKNNPLNLDIIMTGRNQEDGEKKLSELKSKYPNAPLKFIPLEIGNKGNKFLFY